MRSVETVAVARAAAILLVVTNHALIGIPLHGGLNALLVVSGWAMARFGFHGDTKAAVRSMARFGLRLAGPSLIIALIWQVGVGKIDLRELLFFSNWLHRSRVVLLPIWYPQAIVQMLLVIIPIFAYTNMAARFREQKLLWTSVWYAAACAVAFISYSVWDTHYLDDKLPHLIAWNFIFGWLCWAVMDSRLSVRAGRFVLTLVLALSILLLFCYCDAVSGRVRAIYMPLVILPLLWADRVNLPDVWARLSMVVSQATLFLFLFHYYCIWAVWRVCRYAGFEAFGQLAVTRVVAGIVGPVLLWVLWTAIVLVYRRKYRLPRIPAFGALSLAR